MALAIDDTKPADIGKHRLVDVTIDGETKQIEAKTYHLHGLKEALGVGEHRELDEIINGVIAELHHHTPIEVKGGEVFVSHERKGASS